MHPIQKHLFETNFRDLNGSSIEGTLAFSEELINLGVMELLQGLQNDKKEAGAEVTSTPIKGDTSLPDPKELLKLVSVEQLTLRMEQGRLLVDIKAGL